MYHENDGRYGYRRTHSVDSYDTLERLENQRQQRRQFLDSRSKFERLPPSTPPPQVPNQRPITPVSQLIQDFTPKLMDVADSPWSMESDVQRPSTDQHHLHSSSRNGQTISLECPTKVSYTSTCDINITPTQKSDYVEHILYSPDNHQHVDEPDAVKVVSSSSFKMITPYQYVESEPREANLTSSNLRPHNKANTGVFNSPSIAISQTVNTKEDKWCLKNPVEDSYQKHKIPTDQTYYNKPETCERLLMIKPKVTSNRSPLVEKREMFHRQIISPLTELKDAKQHLNSFTSPTPFYSEQIIHENKNVNKILDSQHPALQPLTINEYSPVPTPRIRGQANNTENEIKSPTSYPTYLKTQSIKEWKHVPPSKQPNLARKSFPNYNSLPKIMPCNKLKGEYKYLDMTDSSASIITGVQKRDTSRTHYITGKEPTKMNITFPMPRRSSTGTVGDMRLRRSQMPSVPVKLLVQKFSNK